ncbi:GGDEF domain-containing protein [Oxalobacteraceae bacterium OM1]|nr:GGDEF domain-containing protein [Oxalobacteraceae bacterium OM1]
MDAVLRAVLFHADREQALRVRRFLFGVGAYAMNTGFVLLCRFLGYFSDDIVLHYVLMVLGINAGIFLLLRTGLNRAFRDPSLTLLQMMLGTLAGLYLMYHGGDVRGVFLLLGIAMCVFGMFRFRTADFVRVSAFMLAGYAVVIVLLRLRHPAEIDLKVDMLQWVALLVTLSQFSFLAGMIGRLREKLRQNNLTLNERNAQLEEAVQRINDMAVRDELTGVHNRRYLTERIHEEALRSLRSGSAFSICLLDIDYFKKVNDTYGHLAGDEVLRAVAGAVASSLRQTDVFGRFGGEEFLMVLNDTTANGALVTAERARERVAALRFPAIAPDFRVSISIGVAEHLRGGDTAATLQRADEALYAAKEQGRDRCELAATPAFA